MPQKTGCHKRQAGALFRRTLSDKALDELARETGFVRRQRLVTAGAVVWAFVVTLGGQPTEFISDVLRTLNAREGWTLRYKPFWDRLARASFARFMRELFQRLCRELSLRILEREAGGVAMHFSAIFIDDGSSFAVAHGLRDVFPGRFTKYTPAAVELHAHMDLLSGNLLRVTLAPDKEGERQFLPAPESLPRGSLSLRDRGYIDVPYFARLSDAGAYLICRARTDLNPTIVRVLDGMSPAEARRWCGKRLKELQRKRLRRDLELLVSWPRPDGRTIELRLVIRYVPPKQKAPKSIRAKGVTRKKTNAESWTWLLTNLPPSVSAQAVSCLYRLRWQIELVFKDLKSYANLRALQSAQHDIVEGFIWASLCAAFLKRAVAHLAQLLARRPISTRLAAMAGPHITPLLAAWARSGFRPKYLDALLVFLVGNALPTHPERDARSPAAAVGLRPRTRPPAVAPA
jgi:hypothetical protein